MALGPAWWCSCWPLLAEACQVVWEGELGFYLPLFHDLFNFKQLFKSRCLPCTNGLRKPINVLFFILSYLFFSCSRKEQNLFFLSRHGTINPAPSLAPDGLFQTNCCCVFKTEFLFEYFISRPCVGTGVLKQSWLNFWCSTIPPYAFSCCIEFRWPECTCWCCLMNRRTQ